jgi:hypothetical protein
MRIFSNIVLSRPHLLHINQVARFHPGKWNNYHIFRISMVEPLKIITYSPLNLLEDNRQYFCYHNFLRDRTTNNQNKHVLMNESSNKYFIYVPETVGFNDVIIIHSDFVFTPIMI